ncbi:MAG: hypothetical protein WD971_01320 [Pirellulales bacterium]
MSDANFNSFAAADGSPESTRAEIADLIERLRHASEHLPVERTAHHDLRLLSRPIRELRRAFAVFEPYRKQRKVTIFGSARTPRDEVREFADILTDGEFELHDAVPGEPADPELASLARLVFRFNRRNHGRLRKLIDWINAEVG